MHPVHLGRAQRHYPTGTAKVKQFLRESGMRNQRPGSVIQDQRSPKRATGLEPATASLEGWHSTIELHPRCLFCVNRRITATYVISNRAQIWLLNTLLDGHHSSKLGNRPMAIAGLRARHGCDYLRPSCSFKNRIVCLTKAWCRSGSRWPQARRQVGLAGSSMSQ